MRIKRDTGCKCSSVSVLGAVVKAAEAPVFSCVLGRQVILEAEEEMSEGFSRFEVELAEAKVFSGSGEGFGDKRPSAFRSGGG